MSSNNLYAKAAGAYGTTASAVSSRDLEGHVLLKAALQLEGLAKRLETGETISRTEIGDTIDYNQKLWQLFVDSMKDAGHALPPELKSNVMSLALFVFKRSHDILIDTKPEKFKVLVSINRSIASGLMKKQTQPAAQPMQKPPLPVAVGASSAAVMDSMA